MATTPNLSLTKPAVGEKDWGGDINTNWDTLDTNLPLNRFDATAAPVAGDDSGDGYSVGSRWVDVTNDKAYVCLDATAAAAVWTEVTGGGTGSVLPSTNEGRLTLSSTETVPTSDQSNKSTLRFDAHVGEEVALYDGSSTWTLHSIGSGVTITDSGLSADTNYDVFLYDNSGTLTLELLAWSSDTARATALVLTDGVLTKTGATTRRYLGTVRVAAVDATSPGLTTAGSLTHTGGGAGGNAAMIDNSSTPAADPTGYNTSTSWSVDFGSGVTEDISRLSVVKDATYGLTNAATMKLEYSDNNSTWTQVGSNFTISAGQSTTPEVFTFSHSAGAHRYWRIYYVSGSTGGNFWLREIEMGAPRFHDTARRRLVWNTQNRRRRQLLRKDETSSWTYSSTGWRQANASVDNQLEFVRGLDEDSVGASVSASHSHNTAQAATGVSIGLDSTSATASDANRLYMTNSAVSENITSVSLYEGLPGLGYHRLVWLENTSSGIATFHGDSATTGSIFTGAVWA